MNNVVVIIILYTSNSLIYLHLYYRYKLLDEYPCEPYTDVYFIKYKLIDSARAAKRKLDNWYFFSRRLHVCYAPEYEMLSETREKLMQRQEIIAHKTRESSKYNIHI